MDERAIKCGSLNHHGGACGSGRISNFPNCKQPTCFISLHELEQLAAREAELPLNRYRSWCLFDCYGKTKPWSRDLTVAPLWPVVEIIFEVSILISFYIIHITKG